MPKELHEISQFVTGTMTTPSERDIPDDAASYSLNIDPVSEDGILQGIPEDDNVEWTDGEGGSTTDLLVNATSMAIINDDGDRDLIFFNETDDKIWKVDTVNNAQAASSAVSSTAESKSSTPVMQVNNKEVHIGMGNLLANKPLWAGHIKHEQFGTAYSGIQLEDADLEDPSAFPDIYQFVEVGSYLYGIEFQGQYIYKFENSATGTFIRKSKQIFTKTQGISARAAGGLWVLDIVGSTSNIHVLDTEEMVSEFSVQVTHDAKSSDILEMGNYLWVSTYSDTSAEEAVLMNVAISSLVAGASTQTLTSRTPFSGDSDDPAGNQQGEWLATADHDGAALNCSFVAPKTCLMDSGNTTHVGWAVTVRGGNDSATIYHRWGSGSGDVSEMRHVLFSVRANASVNALTDGTNSKIYRLEAATDLLSDFSSTMFSITARQGGKIIASYGTAGGTTSSVIDGTMIDVDSASNGANIDMSSATTLQLADAVVFETGSSEVNGFSGSGSGQWLRGTAIGSMSQALEANVNLTFSSSNIDYGYSGSTWSAGTRTGFETSGYSYFYKVSFLYDGYQETPLSDEFKVDNSILSGDGRPIDITIQLKNLGSLNKRISHVNLYRASASTASVFAEPEGFYRLVDSYELNTSFASVSATSPWSNYRQKVVRDINIAGASYEGRTGLSEVISNITPRYALSTQLNNQHFIANVFQKDLGAYSNYLYKSKPYRFDQFNFLEDFLVLPTTPTALAAFNGRIFAFDDNNTYQIEPNNLYIEDVIEGTGCMGQDAVFVNDYGMCFADKNSIYLHDGRRPVSIGESILRGGTYSWENKHSAFTPHITFDSFRKSYVIFFRISSSYYAWAYNVPRKRWDLWKFHASNQPQSAVIGKEGEMYVSNGTNLVHFLGHASTKRSWDFTSKKLTMRQNTGDKSFKNMRIVGSPSGSLGNTSTGVYVKIDDTDITEVSITGLTDISLGNTRGKQIQIFLAGQTSTVDAIGTIFRRHILLSKVS